LQFGTEALTAMNFKIGQKVSYPNHGVCKIEFIESKKVDGTPVEFYSLRVLANGSHILIPKRNAETVRLRPMIRPAQCETLLKRLGADFEECSPDWKTRSRDFHMQLTTGDLFETADVLKKLTFLARIKKLSFREQSMLDKAKFLVVSELAAVCSKDDCEMETKVDQMLEFAFLAHDLAQIETVSTAEH
jgi:CarD family transcriptional regulator